MRSTIALSLLVAAVAAIGCSKEQQAQLARLADSLGTSSAASGGGGNDPCTLVSRAEAERILGPLRHDPYRVRGNDPAPTGTACRYEATTGRHIVIEPEFTDGRMAMKVVGMMGGLVQQVIMSDSGQTDTLDTHWDEARVMPGLHLMARLGDGSVDVGYAGAGTGIPGAARFADIALGRIGAPLAYDGASAARSYPGPLVAKGDPCALIDRADVERIIGALAGAPVTSASQDRCTYTLAQSRGLGGREVVLGVEWQEGFAGLDLARASTATVEQHVAPPVARGDNQGNLQTGPAGGQADSQLGGFMNKIMSVAQSQGIGVQLAPGGLKTDTAVAGPWDQGVLLSGLGFSAVKKDVLISVDLRGVTYEQGKALVAAAMRRL